MMTMSIHTSQASVTQVLYTRGDCEKLKVCVSYDTHNYQALD